MRRSWIGWLTAAWGIGGVVGFLASAVVRLVPVAVESFAHAIDGWHVAGYAGSVALLGYSEGYRGFQRAFSPRVVARGLFLAQHPRPSWLHVLLAPGFCMGFFHATRRRLISTWILALGIVGLVVLVRGLEQPWRGMIDLGVAIALAWGTLAIIAYWIAAERGRPLPVEPDLPAGVAQGT